MATLYSVSPVLAQTPSLLVCSDKGYTLTDVTTASGTSVSYKWYEKVNDEDFTEVSKETSASLHLAAKTDAGTYAYVRMAFGEECTDGVPSNTYTVVVLKPTVPTINISAAAVCQNVDDLTFTVTPSDNTTYTWSGTDGTPTGDDKSTYTVGSSSTGTKDVKAKATVFYTVGGLQKTCESAFSNIAQATVNPLPTVTTIGNTAFCGTGEHQLEVKAEVNTSTDGIMVAWYDNSAGTSTAVSSSTTYTTGALTTSATTYYIRATVTATGCVNATLHQVSAALSLNEGAIGGAEDGE